MAISFWNDYQIKKVEIDDKIHTKMKLCAYTTECKVFKTDFVEKEEGKEENILYKDGDFYGYFTIPTIEKYFMKITYPQKSFLLRLKKLEDKLLRKFFLYSILAAIVSFLFAIYALLPLQKALRINEEFVKDILHDFNTPISSMLINLKIFKREIGENTKIKRLENNIQSILSLQDNLRIFLKGVPAQSQEFSLKKMLEEQVNYFNILYPDVSYKISIENVDLKTNKDAFKRVIDNLLSNAGKYNIADGDVFIIFEDKNLLIKDTGKGIKYPEKAFERYYKEQDRGIGIGLHIVKKLCDELKIVIKIESKKEEGTIIMLNLATVIA